MRTIKIPVPNHMSMIDRANFPHRLAKAQLLTTLLVGSVCYFATAGGQMGGAGNGMMPLAFGGLAVLSVGLLFFTGSLVRKRSQEMAVAFATKLRQRGEVVTDSVDRLARMPRTIRTKNAVTGAETIWQASFFDPASVLKETAKG